MLRCHVSLYGSRKLFCKGDCSKNLIETTADRADNNKYSIESYGSWMSSGTVIVTIRQLTKSDEGQYKCGTDGVLKSLTDIVLVVKDGELALHVVSMFLSHPVDVYFSLQNINLK